MDVATAIFGLELVAVELIETEQQRVEDRRADLVARVVAGDGKRFILHIEIQNNNQKDMPIRMLRYLSDIYLGYPSEAVEQYLLYIGKAALSMPSGIQTAQLQYHYTTIDMHGMDYQIFLNQDSPDAMIMALLCDIGDQNIKTVVRDILAKLLITIPDDGKKLREYLSMLEILASNRNFTIDIRQEFEMLQIEIEKLPSFVMGLEKGTQQGFERGSTQRALMIAKQLLNKNIAVTEVAAITGLEAQTVEALANGDDIGADI